MSGIEFVGVIVAMVTLVPIVTKVLAWTDKHLPCEDC